MDLIGPLTIKNRVSPNSKYEALCWHEKCGWADYRFDYQDAADRLIVHIVDAHLTRPRTAEEEREFLKKILPRFPGR